MSNMLKIILSTVMCTFLFIANVNAQNMSINADGTAPDNSAMLDVSSTTSGLLAPRMTIIQRNAITNPATGLLIFQTNSDSGFYYNNGIPASPSWLKMITSASISSLISDADGDTKIQTEETTDEDIIRFDQAGTEFFRMDSGRIEIINTNNSVVLGNNSGSELISNVNSFQNVVVGNNSMQGIVGRDNVGIGFNVMNAPTSNTVRENTAIGQQSMQALTTGFHNTAIGRASLTNMSTGFNNTAIGRNTLAGNTGGFGNLAIGNQAGFNATGDLSVFIGNEAGTGETSSQKLYIENSSSSTPLIYGDFANDTVKVFGTLSVGNAFSFPTADGVNGLLLRTDGSGNVSWSLPDEISDADNDTKIQVEESADEDIIHFDINGTELFSMHSPGRIHFASQHVYIGSSAGNAESGTPHVYESNVGIGFEALTTNSTGNHNVAIGAVALQASTGSSNTAVGAKSLFANTTAANNTAVGTSSMFQNLTGGNNTAIGHNTLSLNQTGSNNVALGQNSLASNVSGASNVALGRSAGSAALGSGNVFLGNESGSNETGSNSLYIDNSNSSTPLIYGDFANDSIKVFGTFSVGNAFSFPTADGTINQVLETDGSGNVTWVTPAAAAADGDGIYDASGSLSGNTVVTQAANTLAFTSTIINGFNVDGTTFSVDAANNRVGIGTASPTASFTVKVNGTAEDNGFKLLGSNGTKGVMIYSDGNGIIELANSGGTKNIKFSGGDNENSYFNTGGKFGIGTNSISSTLDVAGDIETGAANAFYFGDPTTDGTWRIVRDGNDLSFERRESGSWVFKMKINP